MLYPHASMGTLCPCAAALVAPDCDVLLHGLPSAVVAGQLYMVCQLHLLLAWTHAYADNAAPGATSLSSLLLCMDISLHCVVTCFRCSTAATVL